MNRFPALFLMDLDYISFRRTFLVLSIIIIITSLSFINPFSPLPLLSFAPSFDLSSSRAPPLAACPRPPTSITRNSELLLTHSPFPPPPSSHPLPLIHSYHLDLSTNRSRSRTTSPISHSPTLKFSSKVVYIYSVRVRWGSQTERTDERTRSGEF